MVDLHLDRAISRSFTGYLSQLSWEVSQCGTTPSQGKRTCFLHRESYGEGSPYATFWTPTPAPNSHLNGDSSPHLLYLHY